MTIDISTAEYIPMVLPGPLPITKQIKCGILFVFKGGLEEILIVSPQLDLIAEEVKGGHLYLVINLSSPNQDLLTKLELFEMYSPAFIIARYEEESKNDNLIGPVSSWEQGYFAGSIARLTPGQIVFEVQRGTRN